MAMRKRSEVAAANPKSKGRGDDQTSGYLDVIAGDKTVELDSETIASLKPANTWCAECGERQLISLGGLTCKNGHGGADSLDQPDTFSLKSTSGPWKPPEDKPLTGVRKPDRAAATETASQLAKELQKPPPADDDRSDFATKVGALAWEGGFARVVETFFDLPDVGKESRELRAFLKTGDHGSRLSYGDLADQLNLAQENAMRGAELRGQARIAYERYEADAALLDAAMRERARDELTASSDKKPTIGDIDARMATMFPDEVRDLKVRRTRGREDLRMFEELADRLAERAKDLRQFVARVRRPDE